MRARPQRRPRAAFFYAAAGVAVAAWFGSPLPAYAAGLLVDAIPIEEDVSLGVSAVRAAGYRLQDGCRPGRRCVEEIGRSVLGSLRRHMPQVRATIDALDWHFSVTHQAFVNAFAYPGGRIFVTRGLLDMTTDEELAAVIGHEIGHVLHRHSQKRLVQQQLGRLLFDALFFGDGDGRSEAFGSELGGLLHGYASSFSTMSFSRSNEYEADHVGLFACAGMTSGCLPSALSSFFRKLDGGGGVTAWHSTHPGTRDRIATLDDLQATYRRARHTAHGGDSVALAALAPASLAVRPGTGVLGAAGSLWSLMPSGAQRAVVVGALWQAASALEWAWQQLQESSDDARTRPAAARTSRQHREARDWAQRQPRYRPVD